MEILKNLSLDHLSKIIVYLGAILLILSLTVEIKSIPNKDLTIYSVGVLLIGIGEVINNPWTTVPVIGGVYEGYLRKNSVIGVLFIVGGLSVIGYRLIKTL